MRIYTRGGDDGTTGLYFGGRVPKSSEQIEVNGVVDEAQSFLGVARTLCVRGDRVDEILVRVERDLWVLMAEVATLPENRHKLVAGSTMIDESMVAGLETEIDQLSSGMEVPREFMVPGETQLSAALDVARTVVRRAERVAVRYSLEDSLVVNYLNRLSDLIWTLARYAEGPDHRTNRSDS